MAKSKWQMVFHFLIGQMANGSSLLNLFNGQLQTI